MSKIKKFIKVVLALALAAAIALTITTIAADKTISAKSAKYLYDSVDSVPECKTAVVLGCSQRLRRGDNPFFKHRIAAATELYNSGKIEYIIVSGENSRVSYNEPVDMKNALIANGIPAEVIFLDYAGLRTLDSVVRMREIFSQERYIVVSQRFHTERAVFVARRLGMEAYGYNAKDVGGKLGKSTLRREKLARVKAFWDLVVGKQPRFLGEKIDIDTQAANDL